MALPLKVAIIGAGPAGLTLARLLHVSRATIDLTVYELDDSPTSRPDQGGTLDLHAGTGLAAICKCDMWSSSRRYARHEGSELIVVDKNATKLAHVRCGEKKGPLDRPEIDRHRLREILLESVPETCMRWGWHLRELQRMRMGYDGLKVRTWFLSAEGEMKEAPDKQGNDKTLAKLMNQYITWAPEMLELLKQADPNTLKQWTLYELSVGHRRDHQNGFTLIGDAISLSTPFSGEGVKKAMKDALELGEMIEQSITSNDDLTLDQAVLEYEQRIFPRAAKFQAFTRDNKQAMIGSDVPYGLMTPMLKKMADESPSMPMKILGTAFLISAVYYLFWARTQLGWAVRKLWRQT